MKTEEKKREVRGRETFMIPISKIEIEKGFNPRKKNNFGDIDELAQSIAKGGQEDPAELFKVRGEDRYILTRGHRRMMAIAIANEKYIGKDGYMTEKITELEAFKGSSDLKDRLIAAMRDSGGNIVKLTNAELIATFARLQDEVGVSPKELIGIVPMSTAQAYNVLAVLKAPKAIQKMVQDDLISIALVNQIIRKTKDLDKQVELAEEAVGKAQVETPEGKVKKATAKHSSAKTLSPIEVLEAALELADPTTAKAALVKSIVNKLKKKASAEDIAKLLK